jgi:DNA-binding NtrC family response regulator
MPTLLVVDDESSVLSFVQKAMIRRGWTVVEAHSVEDAVTLARCRRVDVALCDVVMPGAGGPDFARALRSGHAAVPIVLMTGYSTARLEDEPMPAWWRPVPILEKPFTVGELDAVLSTVLRSGPPDDEQ